MKIITQTCADLNSNLKLVTRFLKKYQVGLLLKTCNAYKTKGFSVISVFEYLLIELLLIVCQDILHLSDEKMDMLLDQFLQNLPAMIKSTLKPCA